MTARMKRCVLLVIALAPMASVAFAAKSSLSVAQIRSGSASDDQLKGNDMESHGL